MSTNPKYIRRDKVSNFNKDVGLLLKRTRQAQNLSQEAVASRLGMSQDSISRYELGGSTVSAFALREFAKLYGKPVTFFYMADLHQ